MPPGVEQLAQYGLLGVLLMIALGAISWLYSRQNAIWSERLADWKAAQEIQQQQAQALRDLSATSEQRTRAQEVQARALELMAQSHQSLTSEVTRLREKLERFGEGRPG